MTRSLPRLAVWVAGLALLSVAGLLLWPSPSRSRRTLEIELHTSAGSAARLFWSADQHWIEDQSFRVPLQPSPGEFQRLRFPLPPEGMPWIRLEPTNAQSEIVLGRMRLFDSRERLIGALDSDVFRPISQVASVVRMGDGLHVVTSPGATNPALITTIACLDRILPLGDRSRVTPTAVALVSAVLGALLLASIAIVGGAVFGPPTGGHSATSRQLGLAGLWLAALFLIVFSAKLLLIRDTPVMTPFWDQWGAVGGELFIPYKECRLPWSTMFALHNEHRIFFTRLLALDLLAVNGQWDPRFEQVVDVAIHSLTAVIVAAVFWVTNGRRRLDLLVLVCALVFALPFGWENTLVGFQSQFYFFVLLSILAFWLTSAHRVFTLPWCLGAACAFCALFTCAGGVLTGAVVAGMTLLKLIGDRRDWRRDVIGLAIGTAILAIGAAIASPPIAGHEPLKAHSTLEFLRALATNMAWPWIRDRRAAIVMWLPLGLLLVPLLRRPSRFTVHDRLIVGVSAWVILNGVAVAYGRGSGAPIPASRYMDFLSLGLVANAMAFAAVVDRLGATGTKRLAYALIGLWLVFSAVGVDRLLAVTDVDLGHYRNFYAAHTANVRAFVVTGNRKDFTSKRPLYDLPFPDVSTLVSVLENPAFHRILPTTVREPLPVQARTMTNEAFVQDGPFVRSVPRDPLARYWWSLSERGKIAQGSFESQPLSCQFGGRLRIQVSGYLGWEHQYLAFKNLRTGQDTPIRPGRVAREDWLTLLANCPPDPFEIVAIDDAPDSWFGFREPVEIGGGSLMAEWLIARSRLFLLIGFAMAVLALRWSGSSATSDPDPLRSVATRPEAVVL